MPTRSRRLSADANRRAIAIVQEAISEAPPDLEKYGTPNNPAAVTVGKLSEAKGGKARATSPTELDRSESARKAAVSHWNKK